jgi:hypothetical protein
MLLKVASLFSFTIPRKAPRRPSALVLKPDSLRYCSRMRLRKHPSLLLAMSSAISTIKTRPPVTAWLHPAIPCLVAPLTTLRSMSVSTDSGYFRGLCYPYTISKVSGPSPLQLVNWTWLTLSRLWLVERRVSSVR